MPPDRALQPIRALSGGQKAKVVLAGFLLEPANLLLLDEPTNHLDTEMAEALVEALLGWEGGLVVVTHDRWLVDRIANRVCGVRGGLIRFWDRVVPEALDWASAPAPARGPAEGEGSASGAEVDRVRTKAERAELRKRQRRYERLEQEIARLSDRLEALDRELVRHAADREVALALAADREGVEAELERAFDEAASLEEALQAD